MLVEESIWIAEKIKEILPEEPFPVLNIGSSTLVYRTKKQPFIQNTLPVQAVSSLTSYW